MRYVLIVSLGILMVLFQNCQQALVPKNSSEVISSSLKVDDVMEKKVRTTNKVFPSGKELIFYINPKIYSNEVEYNWFKTIDSGFCFSEPHEFDNAIKVTCTKAGELSLIASVISPDSTVEEISFEASIVDGSLMGDISDEELYFNEDDLAVRIDGSIPGQVETDVPSQQVASGAGLYQQHCASCHSTLATNDIGIASASLISSRIISLPAMNHLMFLSSQEIQAISDAL